jgi:hypothetical protein
MARKERSWSELVTRLIVGVLLIAIACEKLFTIEHVPLRNGHFGANFLCASQIKGLIDLFGPLRRHFCESRTSFENGQILVFENMHNLLTYQ